MILLRLILHHARHGLDHKFSELQVEDAINWVVRHGVSLKPGMTVLDLGCGSGVFGAALMRRGCRVTFADENDWLSPEIPRNSFRRLNIDTENPSELGSYDLVVCSNVLEHLRRPQQFLAAMNSIVNASGWFYLSWTNWLSPWGGHDFSPFHYLGPRLGPWLFDRIVRRPRSLEPYENLFPTHIGQVLRALKRSPGLRIIKVAPRYYTELWPIMKIPLLREFFAWNCAVLLRKDNRRARSLPTTVEAA